MKSLIHASALIATAAMMSGQSHGSSNVIKNHSPEKDYYAHTMQFAPSKTRRNKTSVKNQRQLRKDRRRAWAAGNKKAFN